MSRIPDYRSNRPAWVEELETRRAQERRGEGRLPTDYLTGGLLVAVAVLLVSEVPQIPAIARTLLFQAAAFGILALLALSRTFAENMAVALRRGPNPFLLTLLLWCGVSAFYIAPSLSQELLGGASRGGHPAVELLRVLTGVGVYLLAAYALPQRRSAEVFSHVVMGILGIGVLIALYDFVHFGQMVGGAARSVEQNNYSVFGTHETVGSLLVLLMPVALVFAISPATPDRARLLAQATSMVLGAALLIARTRSAWIAGFAAVLVLGILFARYLAHHASSSSDDDRRTAPPPDYEDEEGHGNGVGRRRRRTSQRKSGGGLSPVVGMTIGFAVLIALGGIAPIVSERAGTMKNVLEDASLEERLTKWRGATRMAAERPLTGWGLGSYTIAQSRWTHRGDDIPEVLTQGTGHDNIAHNYYVQWAADAGAVGLALHVAVVLAFLAAGLRALPRIDSGFHRTLLIGCMAAVVGGSVDAIASPSYNFPGVWAVFFLWMGLGVAAMRGDRETRRDPAPAVALPSAPLWTHLPAVVGGLLAAGVVLSLGNAQLRAGASAPKGKLSVTVKPEGVVKPGTMLYWTAVYRDASGRELPTMPGTRWTFVGNPGVTGGSEAAIITIRDPKNPKQPTRSGLQVTLPKTINARQRQLLVTSGATYWDEYGRRHAAVASVVIQQPAFPEQTGR